MVNVIWGEGNKLEKEKYTIPNYLNWAYKIEPMLNIFV
jgi:hypothetical protein